MLSKSTIAFIHWLHKEKKFREEQGLFVVEGFKSVMEFFRSSYLFDSIFYTKDIDPKLLNIPHKAKLIEVTALEMKKISHFKMYSSILALIKIPQFKEPESQHGYLLVLDGVQDPGNLGTIIRTADWFGMPQIVCSIDSVDVYNTKVVQASMGSLSRVLVRYSDLPSFLENQHAPVYGALVGGGSIFKTRFDPSGIVLLGSEGKGIREPLKKYINHYIEIPRYGGAESLNVAIAAAIFCAELKKQFDH